MLNVHYIWSNSYEKQFPSLISLHTYIINVNGDNDIMTSNFHTNTKGKISTGISVRKFDIVLYWCYHVLSWDFVVIWCVFVLCSCCVVVISFCLVVYSCCLMFSCVAFLFSFGTSVQRLRPRRLFWGPLAATLDFESGAVLQAVGGCPRRY